MVEIGRLHGRTPLQRCLCYHIFHNDSSSSSSIFNTTYNFNGGFGFGGSFMSGMWGGLGMGIGAALMNFLGGGLNMFGGMFGGFSGISPFSTFWGGGSGNYRINDGAGGVDKPDRKTRRKNKETNNPENKNKVKENEKSAVPPENKTEVVKAAQSQNVTSNQNDAEPTVGFEIVKGEKITANYHYGNNHTWQGIASLYNECKKHGHSQSDIIREIKRINNIPSNDNVIPKDLYLPEYLFGENDGKRLALNDNGDTASIGQNDDKEVKPCKEVKSNATGFVETNKPDTYRGIKTKGENVLRTDDTYKTSEEALKAAKNLKFKDAG